MNQSRPTLPDPATAPELFEGILTRRAMAFAIDLVAIGLLILVFAFIGFIAGFLTFGLAWIAMVFVAPASIVLYYAATLGSHRRATLGMQMMDIVLTPTRGAPLDGWMAMLHAGLFWITAWISLPISLLFTLFTPRRQMIHDLILGALVIRRSPMERHWRQHRARSQGAH